MSNLNSDIFYLIFKELKDDGNALFSCLLVNKICFNIIIPILWKNPWKYLKKEINDQTIFNMEKENKYKKLLDVIISHLSDESRNNIKNKKIFLTNLYQKPLIDYISFCKHLNFNAIFDMISSIFIFYTVPIIENEIINLFINENMRFTHLYIPSRFNYKIYLIPGFENCFSGLEFLKCDLDNNDQSILEELTRTSKSIKNLELTFFGAYIPGLSGITKLIETQKELSNVSYLTYYRVNESSRKSLEDSLIKRTNNTLQYLKINKEPSNIKFFSYFVDLISLEINDSYNDSWKHLVDATLPHLKFLKAKNIPSNNLAKLIENTSEELEEISINSLRCNDSNYGDLIQTIAQSCPNLKYFMLILRNRDIINLEKVLINCQYLSGLNIVIYKYDFDFDWKKLFIILTKSSPIGLYKFKFYIFHDKSLSRLNSDSFNLFFANWKGRQPMLLQTVPIYSCISFKKYFNLIETYKAKGIVKKYEYVKHENIYYEEFEWINQRI